LRLRLFADGMLPSRVTTRSYIYKWDDYYLPVLSVVTDPDFLYSREIGVFEQGPNGRPGNGQSSKCNWNMDWERPVNFSYLDENGMMVFNQDANLEMCGGWSRAWEPHSFKLKGQKEYGGNKNLDYPFFAEKPYIRNRTLQVRNGGNDNNNRFKDPALEEIIFTSGIDIDIQSYLPVHEFINGEYIGMLNLREPNNKHYVYANYGWDDEEIDLFEMDADSAYVQKCGTRESFEQLYQLCKNASNNNNYEQIKQCLDIDEYINYMAMQMYLGGNDWPQNNIKGFKRRPDGKFRFVSFDLDFAFNTSNSFNDFSNKRTYTFNWLYDKQTSITTEIEFVTIFVRLLTNKDFRRQFIDTYCIMGGSVFEPTRSAQVIDSLAERAYPLQHLEWGTPWNMANELKSKLSNRMSVMTNTLKNYSPMGLTNTNPRRGVMRSNVKGAAIYVNDTKVPTGYFDGNLFAPVKIKTVAPAGYDFKGWVNAKSLQKPVFGRNESWLYYDKGNIGTTNWMAEDYVTTGWKTGYAPLGYGKDGLYTTISYGNNSGSKYPTYYFRKLLTLADTPADDTTFILDFTVDDGFIIYVNGKEAGRYNMPSGNVNYNTYATTYAPDNPDNGEMTLPASLFKKGNNIIAVEVHNNSGSSSDIYWDANLYYTYTDIDGGFYSTDTEIDLPNQNFSLMAYYEKKNPERLAAEGFTPVRINEVSADNSIYINEYFKKGDWVELYNTTGEAIDIAGMYLSDKETNPHKYQITGGDNGANTIIPAYGHLLVWCDKQPTAQELHADFKLANEGGVITLTAADDSWTDRMPYPEHDGNTTIGRYPDGANDIYVMNIPTIHKANMLSTYAELYMSTTEGISDIHTHADRNVSLRYAGNWLNVYAKGQQRVSVAVYTLQGQLVYTTTVELHDGYAQIPVESLGRGCFVAKATTENRQSSTCKFIQ
ncbi:MAG: CotH kinase family protein, partial [Prevotella sp.]|nr:CotH kinase family protein [Prevotella sp.]